MRKNGGSLTQIFPRSYDETLIWLLFILKFQKISTQIVRSIFIHKKWTVAFSLIRFAFIPASVDDWCVEKQMLRFEILTCAYSINWLMLSNFISVNKQIVAFLLLMSRIYYINKYVGELFAILKIRFESS